MNNTPKEIQPQDLSSHPEKYLLYEITYGSGVRVYVYATSTIRPDVEIHVKYLRSEEPPYEHSWRYYSIDIGDMCADIAAELSQKPAPKHSDNDTQ